jgi:starch-binding outer membrane protein SusE/F
MKKIFKILAISSFFLGFVSCEIDENKPEVKALEAEFKLLTPETGTSLLLNEVSASNPALTFSWEKALYSVQTNVTYTLQFAESGTDFATPVDISTSTNTNSTITVEQLNLASLNLGLIPFVQGTIEARIKSSLGSNGNDPKYSDVVSINLTPYGCLDQYAVGAALVGTGWGWSTPTVMNCDDNILTSNVNFANDTFRFFTKNGDWGSGRNYPYYSNANYVISSSLVNANDGDSNFRFTGTPGNYRLTVNEINKTIKVAQGDGTNSYWLVGAATPGGWSWSGGNETELGIISNGVYEVPVELKNNETFRVWFGNDGGDSWGSPNSNYPQFLVDGYTISSDFVNANDGDSNFRYVGTTATKLFKIDTVNKTITFN